MADARVGEGIYINNLMTHSKAVRTVSRGAVQRLIALEDGEAEVYPGEKKALEYSVWVLFKEKFIQELDLPAWWGQRGPAS